MKTLSIFTIVGTLGLTVGYAAILLPGLSAQDSPEPAKTEATKTEAAVPAADKPDADKPDAAPAGDDAEASGKSTLRRNEKTGAAPTRTVEQAHERLIAYRSLKAEIVQTVRIGDSRFRIEGQYLHGGSDLKLRLEYDLKIGTTTAHLLEICDGQILRTHTTVGDRERVTRRNVRQILEAASRSSNSPENLLNGELGLGGLRGLLASIEKAVQFDKQWEQDAAGRTFVVVEGGWKSRFRQKFLRSQTDDPDAILPSFVPDKVRLYLEADSLFPRRILYLKRDASDVFHPMVSIDFVTVETNIDIPEDAFVFTPPKNVTQEDVTEAYVRRFTEPEAQPAAPQ